MKDLLDDFLIEPFRDGFYFLGCLMWLFALLLMTGFIWLNVWLIDSSFLPIKQEQGVVTDKYYQSEYTTTTYTQIGNIQVPITNYYPESFNLVITINGLSDNVSVHESYYDKTKIGEKICCQYTNGRILNTMYVKSFCR